MAKWKNDNGPALWPIDMSQISRVHFVAIPQTDVSSVLTEVEISRESSKIPECPIDLKTNATLYSIINILCKRLGRRTPDSPDYTKGALNTDVLRLVLEKTILSIKVPNEQKTNTELGQEQVGKSTNEWGICYDDLRNSYIDVEYETIFGETKIAIAQYIPNSQPIVIEAKCEQCLITRASDGSISDINEQELSDIEWQTGPFVCSVTSEMVYLISVKLGNEVFKTDKMTIRRPLEFIFEPECPTFLEDGPEQRQLPKQTSDFPIYFDDAKVIEQDEEVCLLVGNHTITIGSINLCKSKLARLMFNRTKSKYCKSIMLMEVYDKIDTSGIPWDGKKSSRTKAKRGFNKSIEDWFDEHPWEDEDREETRVNVTSKRFTSTLSAAIKSFNNDMSKEFGIADMKVLELKNKEVFISSRYLSPQLRQNKKRIK